MLELVHANILSPDKRSYRPCGFHMILTCPITRVVSMGRRNTQLGPYCVENKC